MVKEEKNLDLLIIGAGPAGLTAAIFGARLKLNTLVLEDELIGGQIRDAYIVENYPGFLKISGNELTEKIEEQARNSGAIIDEFDKILSVKLTDNEKIIETQSHIYKPKALIIASGSKRKELPVPEEKKFHGNGIHYCELCDGYLYDGKDIAIIGGGNSAIGAANFLSKYAKSMTIISITDSLTGDKKNVDELLSNKKVTFIPNSEVKNALGEDILTALKVQNLKTNQITELKLDGVFVYIGLVPRTDLYKNYINIDSFGNIIAGETCETNVKGVFAAGDVRTKTFRQLTTAVSDGTTAALMAEKFILGS